MIYNLLFEIIGQFFPLQENQVLVHIFHIVFEIDVQYLYALYYFVLLFVKVIHILLQDLIYYFG
jgi:hypothetical protein